MKQAWVALLAMMVTATAGAQGLPPDVTQAYRAYQAALDAGDTVALLESARGAYEAGDEAGIDRATLATLAENYGFAASLNGEYETAQLAWRNAARLSDRANADPVERAWRWHNAALVALHNEDRSDAYACSRNAANALEELGAALAPAADFAGDAFLTRAALAMGRGRIHEAGEAALQSAAAFEMSLVEPTSSYGLALFYAGISQTLDRDFDAATYSLHMAIDVMEEKAPDHPDRRTMRAALVSARGARFDDEADGGDEGPESRLNARLAQNPFHTARYLASEAEDEADEADETDEGVPCCDAAPIRRREPSYPMEAAYSDLDGVVYATFAVTEEGRTDAIEVTGSFPPGVFDQASINAIEDWTYEPATRDGVPVRREGVVTRFDFRMRR